MNTIQQETCGVCGGVKSHTVLFSALPNPTVNAANIHTTLFLCNCQSLPIYQLPQSGYAPVAHMGYPPVPDIRGQSSHIDVTLDTVEQGNQDMMILWQDVQRENARLSARMAEREHLLREARTLLRRDEVEMARFTQVWEEERDALLTRIEAVLKETHD